MSATIVAELKKLKEEQTKKLDELLSSLVDKTTPVMDRWALLNELHEVGVLNEPGDTFGDGLCHLLGPNCSIFDDFYVERHETSTYLSMYERMQESSRLNFQEKNIHAWMEGVFSYVVEYHSVSFTYDW